MAKQYSIQEIRERSGDPIGAERRSIHRAIAAKVLALSQSKYEADFLRSAWPDDSRAAAIVKATSSPTTTAIFPAITTTSLLRNLAPSSAALRLFAAGLQVDLSGINSVMVPKIAMPPAAVFVAEGAPMPVPQYSTSATKVGPMAKILFSVLVSRELQEATPGTATGVIGAIMDAQASRSIDVVAFGSAAATAAQPAGLLNGLVALTASTQTGWLAIAEDVSTLAAAIAAANVDPSDMIIVAAPRQAAALSMMPKLPYTVLSTLGLADKTVVGIAPAAVASAFAEPVIETSKQVAMHDEDTSPQPITGGTPSPAVPVRSTFQQDLIAIRCRAKATWALVAPGAAMITATSW
jgi:hypothetical protein